MSSSSNCPHHWLIEPAGGPTSRGVCTLCGKRKRFSNSIEDKGWSHYHLPPLKGKEKPFLRLHHTPVAEEPGPEWENGVKVLEEK